MFNSPCTYPNILDPCTTFAFNIFNINAAIEQLCIKQRHCINNQAGEILLAFSLIKRQHHKTFVTKIINNCLYKKNNKQHYDVKENDQKNTTIKRRQPIHNMNGQTTSTKVEIFFSALSNFFGVPLFKKKIKQNNIHMNKIL